MRAQGMVDLNSSRLRNRRDNSMSRLRKTEARPLESIESITVWVAIAPQHNSLDARIEQSLAADPILHP